MHRMFLSTVLWTGLTACVLIAGCQRSDASKPGDEAETITVFAAASTTDVIRAIAEQYERETAADVRTNFASSSTLAKQIAAGAEADIYLSANPRWTDHLEEHGHIRSASRENLLANRLVLIAPERSDVNIKMASSFAVGEAFEGRLAMGSPSHVPAGLYGKQALQSLGWWSALEPRLVPCRNVRAALRLVELGEAQAGLVYRTDAMATERVRTLGMFPADSHRPVRYPVALCRGASTGAGGLLRYLRSPEAVRTFERAGFEVVPGTSHE